MGSKSGSRRALSNLGGRTRGRGPGEPRALLERAFAAAGAGESEPPLTHGFHTYPARMHHAIVRALLEQMPERERVLDPFCGSGTVLVEGVRAGREVAGIDLNPIAIALSRVKCELRSPAGLERFERVLERIGAASEARVRARVDVRARLSTRERAWYDPHVLKELAGLLEEIRTVEHDADREALTMVFSALVLKFSRQRADTTEVRSDKRIRKGLVSEFFVRKGQELARRWQALRGEAPPRPPRPRIQLGDARDAAAIVGRGSVDLVVSSPPYGGTYDYLAHVGRRLAWLGLDAAALAAGEIGARRQMERAGAAERWDREVTATLSALGGVLAPDGLAVLLWGDGEVEGRRVDVRDQLARLAPAANLRVVAVASQPRPDFHGSRSRREHLIALAADRG